MNEDYFFNKKTCLFFNTRFSYVANDIKISVVLIFVLLAECVVMMTKSLR